MKNILFILALFPLQLEAQATINTIAGNGTFGSSGDGGSALSASLVPRSVTGDKYGNIIFTDKYNNAVRKIDPSGVINTIAIIPAGNSVTTDTFGNLYVGNINQIKKIDPAGVISIVVGNGISGFSGDGGPATAAQIWGNAGGGGDFFKVDDFGNIFIIDFVNSRLRKVDTNGIINTIAGNGIQGYRGDGDIADSAEFNYPLSIALDHLGNIYIGDEGNTRLRKIDQFGMISTIMGNLVSGCSNPAEGIHADSACASSMFSMCVDKSNNLYLTDVSNKVIRKINSSGIVIPIAGGGTSGLGDGGNPLLANLIPYGVYVDNDYNIFIADFENYRIRKVISSEFIPLLELNTFRVYPNPAKDYIQIESQYPINTIEIYNLVGQIKVTSKDSPSINIAGLSTGIYFIRINNAITQTFIKS